MPELIKRYQVRHYSNVKGFDHTTRAMVWLFGKTDNLIGILRFKIDPADVVPDHGSSGGGIIHLNYPPESFPEVIDLLRNERPLYLDFADEPGYGVISTRPEPVGEEET